MKNMLQRFSCITLRFKAPYLSKMKELNQIILGKRLFASIKGYLCFTKGHSDNLEELVRLNPP